MKRSRSKRTTLRKSKNKSSETSIELDLLTVNCCSAQRSHQTLNKQRLTNAEFTLPPSVGEFSIQINKKRDRIKEIDLRTVPQPSVSLSSKELQT